MPLTHMTFFPFLYFSFLSPSLSFLVLSRITEVFKTFVWFLCSNCTTCFHKHSEISTKVKQINIPIISHSSSVCVCVCVCSKNIFSYSRNRKTLKYFSSTFKELREVQVANTYVILNLCFLYNSYSFFIKWKTDCHDWVWGNQSLFEWNWLFFFRLEKVARKASKLRENLTMLCGFCSC